MFKRMFATLVLVLLAANFALATDPTVLKFRIGSFSTLQGMPSYKAMGLERSEAVKADESAYYIVQFSQTPDDQIRNAIERAGGKVFDYIPNNAHVVKMNSASKAGLEKMGLVQFIGYYQPAFRINPSLLENQTSLDNEESGRIELNVLTFEVSDRTVVKDRLLKDTDVRFLQEDQNGRMFQVSIPSARSVDICKTIANYSEVRWVERKYPVVLHNAWSRWINQSRDTTGMGSSAGTWYPKLRLKSADDSTKMPIYRKGLYGQGQIVHVDDTGMDWDNVYTRDPGGLKPIYDKDKDTVCEATNAHRKIVAYNVHADTFDLTSSGHGSHTTGSVAGDSMGSTHSGALTDTVLARAMGMAPLARIAFTDIGGGSDALVLPTNYADIYRWGYNAGARISSSSWGQSSGGYSSYTANCEQVDTVAWQHQDYLMFRSSGNSNTDGDSANTPATAKNIVCVGANESGFGAGATAWQVPGTTDRNEISDVAEFSSHGPTREGLRRPHILASGGWYIWSVDSDGSLTTNNSGIITMGGTSMSTPTSAGLAALVRQYLTEGWWKTGTKQAADAIASPSGSLMKSLMMLATRNTAGAYSTDLINQTATQNVPSQGQGWGAVVLDDALYFSGDVRKLRIDDTRSFTASGQSFSYTVTTGTSTDTMNPFKVVLSYFDYPSALSPMDISVNNLNLTVTDGSGNTYLGNVFGTNGKSTTGGTADTINNDEVVWLLPSAAKGSRTMTITVTAATIVRSPQPFTITVGGDIVSSTNFRSDPSAVELALFTAMQVGDAVKVSWKTSSETDCDHWEIERSTIEDGEYLKLSEVPGNLTTNEPHEYAYIDSEVKVSGLYYYRLVEVDGGGQRTYYGPQLVEYGGAKLPSGTYLEKAYPNPATSNVTIKYALGKAGRTTLKVYNVLGQEVRTLVSGHQTAGYYNQSWDGKDSQGRQAANGIYLYQLTAGEFTATGKVMIIR